MKTGEPSEPVVKERIALLEAAGFRRHPSFPVWVDEVRRKLIAQDAVRRRSTRWLKAWITADGSSPGAPSVWFEIPPTPDELEGLFLLIGW